MTDELDIYLNRSLKNWTANHQPPIEVRERLLKAASSLPIQQEKRLTRLLCALQNQYFLGPQGFYSHYEHEWSERPVSQSRAWYNDMTLDPRMAT